MGVEMQCFSGMEKSFRHTSTAWLSRTYVFLLLLQPDTVGSLPSLEELWLDCNEISELPPVCRLSAVCCLL